jgi:hypothetical protein
LTSSLRLLNWISPSFWDGESNYIGRLLINTTYLLNAGVSEVRLPDKLAPLHSLPIH